MVLSGFSAIAEHAHKNQGWLPFFSVLGQRAYSNHAHSRGNHHLFDHAFHIHCPRGESKVAGSFLAVEFQNPVTEMIRAHLN
jgi:hypothetical protein